jgi:hypothetical protein
MSKLDAPDDDPRITAMQQRKSWRRRKGLSVINTKDKNDLAKLKREPKTTADVWVVTSHDFKRAQGAWFLQTKWHTVIADEAHDYLRGNHNDRTHISNTLKNWYALQHRTMSMFLVTGTPFCTKISFDFQQITRAVAKDSLRAQWKIDCSDTALGSMVRGWHDSGSTGYQTDTESQVHIRDCIKNALAVFMLRRDETSEIRGKRVLRDYFAELVRLEEPVPLPSRNEFEERDRTYRMLCGTRAANSAPQIQNDRKRMLSWSYRYLKWDGLRRGEKSKAWIGYTLREAQAHVRTNELIRCLEEAHRRKEGAVVFCQRIFLMEMAVKVLQPSHLFFPTFTEFRQICELLKLKVGFIGAQGQMLLGTRYTPEMQEKTVRQCGTDAERNLDVVVVSVQSGKNGVNLQSMSYMISLGWISIHEAEVQALGIGHLVVS